MLLAEYYIDLKDRNDIFKTASFFGGKPKPMCQNRTVTGAIKSFFTVTQQYGEHTLQHQQAEVDKLQGKVGKGIEFRANNPLK